MSLSNDNKNVSSGYKNEAYLNELPPYDALNINEPNTKEDLDKVEISLSQLPLKGQNKR
jgi:hypothetical protein